MTFELQHRIVFLRHGETDWNVEGRLQGQHDIPLNSNGRQQAERSGLTVLNLLGRPEIESGRYSFQASPLSRTRATMEIARRAMGLDPEAYVVEDQLKELSFGRWEGFTWPEVQADEPGLAARREREKWGFRPPEGESYAMLGDRLAPWIRSLTGPAVVVSHGGVARVLMALVGGMATERAAMAPIHQDRPIVFDRGRFDWV